MKTIIVYSSKHGAVKEVAEYLQATKHCTAILIREVSEDIDAYDIVVLGACITAGKVDANIITLYQHLSKDTKILVYLSGLQKEAFETVMKENFAEGYKERIHYSCFVGGKLNFPDMNFFERGIIKVINKKIKVIAAIDTTQCYDFFDHEAIQTLGTKI